MIDIKSEKGKICSSFDHAARSYGDIPVKNIFIILLFSFLFVPVFSTANIVNGDFEAGNLLDYAVTFGLDSPSAIAGGPGWAPNTNNNLQ